MADPLKPAYLVTGSDKPKVRRALERLKARVGKDAAETLSAAAADGPAAVAAANARGLFGGEVRLVVVEDVERWKADDVKAVAAYLDDPAPDTVLALVGDAIRKDGPLAKAVARTGDVLVFDIAKRELPRWVREQFQRLGADADPAACRLLVQLVGDDAYQLENEVAKLATWAAGETVCERDVELLVAPTASTPVYLVTDAWGRRDAAAALAAYESMLERSPEPGPRTTARVAGALLRQVRLVRRCQELDAEGVRPQDALERLRREYGLKARFQVERAYEYARNYSPDELASAVVRLAALDSALKGRSRLSAELETARALVDLSRGEPAASGAPSTAR